MIILSGNLLEDASSVTASPVALETKPVTRLYDRVRAEPYEGGSAAQTDIVLATFASARTASAFGLVNHNLTGVMVQIRRDATGSALVASLVVDADPFYSAFTSASDTDWRIRIPAFASAPSIGELMLDVSYTIEAPNLPNTGTRTVLNVKRWLTSGGARWAAELGNSRLAFPFGWNAIPDADVTDVRNALAAATSGAKAFLMTDGSGTARWVHCLNDHIDPIPLGDGLNELRLDFEESLT